MIIYFTCQQVGDISKEPEKLLREHLTWWFSIECTFE